MIFNESAQKLFGELNTDGISPISGYDIERKKDQFGRVYYSVPRGCFRIKEDSDLSWDEWDGNEVYVSDGDLTVMFEKTVGIMKSWMTQMKEKFPDEHFVVFASYDDGSQMAPELKPVGSFTLRFWKIREGQGLDENADFDQPVIRMIV